MRIIKLGIISVVFFFLLLTGISLLFPSHIRISRAINLKGDRDSILALIRNTSNWSRWHPAFQQNDIAGTLAKNNLTIQPLNQTDSLVVVQLKRENKSVINGWQLYTFSPSDSLALQWYMDFHLQWYPWEKFSSLFYEKTYGGMMEQGLMNMRQILSVTE